MHVAALVEGCMPGLSKENRKVITQGQGHPSVCFDAGTKGNREKDLTVILKGSSVCFSPTKRIACEKGLGI